MAKDMDAHRFFEWLLEEPDEGDRSREVVLVKKVCMLGEPAVGKTSLIRRFVYDVFEDKYIETIGAKVTKKTLRIRYLPTGQTFQLRMMIWDIAGHGALDFVKPSYYRDAEGALLVSDLTRQLTLNKLPDWVDSLFGVTGTVPLVMIGNKKDLEERHEFGGEDLAGVANKFNSPSIMTSAKEGNNVEKAFRTIGLQLIQRFLKEREE